MDEAALPARLQLLTQVADVNVHHVAPALVAGPHLFLYLVAGEDLARVLGQKLQKLKLLVGELNAPPGPEDLPALEVDDQVRHPDLPGDGRGHPAQVGPHPGQKLLNGKGLHQVVVGPGVQALDLVLNAVLGGEDEDGHVGGFADAPGHLNPVHDGEHQVQDDQVGVHLPELGKPGDAVVGHLGAVALGLKLQLYEAGDVLFVLHDQDQRGFHALYSSSLSHEKVLGVEAQHRQIHKLDLRGAEESR